MLTRMFLPYRRTPATANPRTLADGSWILYPAIDNFGAAYVLMIKVPPQPVPDGVDRTTFIPVPIRVGPPGVAGVDNAVVEFGYHEEGAPTEYRCTSREETCVATAESVNPGDPFKFKVREAHPGVPCRAGCTVMIPAIPQRVVYWVVKYRDARGLEVGSGEWRLKAPSCLSR